MIELYQMVDPGFMSHIKTARGQIFVRKAGENGLAMVTGIIRCPSELQDESIYPVNIEFDTSRIEDVRELAEGQSISGMLSQAIWRV